MPRGPRFLSYSRAGERCCPSHERTRVQRKRVLDLACDAMWELKLALGCCCTLSPASEKGAILVHIPKLMSN
jgi:hypothetical protein